MKAADWIDRVKEARGWESDYRAAKELGLSRNTISNYRVGVRNTLDDDTAVRVADALQVEPELVILDQVAERTKSDRARSALSAALERMQGKEVAALRAGGGGKGQIDISSVTLAGGDPSELHRNTHRINWIPLPDLARFEQQRERSEAALLQVLANRHAAQVARPTAAHH